MRTKKANALFGDSCEFKQRDHLEPTPILASLELVTEGNRHTRRYQLGYFDPILAAYVPRPLGPGRPVPVSAPSGTYYSDIAYTLSVSVDHMSSP